MTRRRWLPLDLLAVSVAMLVPLTGATAGAAAPPAAEQVSQTRKVPAEGGHYTDVSAAGLAGMLHAKTFPLVNVHIPYEGEIEPTDLFIPFDQIAAALAKLPEDKHARVVLYCRSGSMSATAARVLVKLGYTDVWNLDGGMIAWARAGHPVISKPR